MFRKDQVYSMNNLSDRENKILLFMKDYIQKNGFAPSVRDICTGLNIKSTSTVHKDMANLEKQGYISKSHTKSRALNVEDITENNNSKIERKDIMDIPVVGRIAAGTPILAEENVEDSIPVPSRFLSSSKTPFLLKVHGESMIEAGIMDGDYILAEQQNTANNGDIVIAMLEEEFEPEATVKTFYKEDDYIRLQPENSSMQPIITKNVQILGKVKGVFRYLS